MSIFVIYNLHYSKKKNYPLYITSWKHMQFNPAKTWPATRSPIYSYLLYILYIQLSFIYPTKLVRTASRSER